MANVTKKEIVEEIALRTGLTQVDTKTVVECFLDAIARSLVAGRNIEIRGFGRFKLREKRARLARNPRTGEPVEVESGIKPVFEASRELRRYLNDNFTQEEGESAPEASEASASDEAGDANATRAPGQESLS